MIYTYNFYACFQKIKNLLGIDRFRFFSLVIVNFDQ